MTKLRLVLLATTAFGVTQIAVTTSYASNGDAPILLAQAAPPAAEGEPKGAPKGPPPAAAPRPAPPAAAPPAAAPPPRAEPPAPRPAPPAPPAAAPAPRAEPPAAPRAAPPAPPAARPAPEAAPPPRPTPPTPPAAAPAPRAEPPAAPTPPAAARPERREAPAGTERRERPDGERREPGARPTPPATPPAAQTPAQPATPPAAAPAPSATPPAGAAPSGRPGGPEGREGGRRGEGRPGAPGAAPGAPATPGTPPAAVAPGAAPGTPPTAAAPVAPPPTPSAAPLVVAPGGGNIKVVQPPAPQVTTPIPPAPPPAAALAPIAPGAAPDGPRRLDDFRGQRSERREGGRTIITEPGRIIVQDPSGQSYIRHNEVDRFRYGARDIRTQRVGNEDRTIVVRPDGSQIITVVGQDGQLMRRIRRDREGREIIIIDNSFDGPRGGPRGPRGGFYVDLPPPMIRIPQNRYIVDYDQASPDLVYDTLIAPPVDRIERRYTLDEVRYSPSVRQRMPSIDLDSINLDLGSWDIPPDQASKLQVIADGLNRAISRNPRAVFLIEGHTDAVGSDVDNLSLSDRRAQSAAELLTQQFQVPAENLTSQGYGEQYLKIQTDGPERQNRRVTVRNITPLLNGGQASLPPPPPGTAPPRR